MDPRLVRISFTLKYVECDLAEKRYESAPVAELFFSNHFERSFDEGGATNIKLDEDHLEKTYQRTLTAKLGSDHHFIPPTACIGINSFAIHRNETGAACYVNVGTSHAFIGQMLDELEKKGSFDHTFDLLMRTVVITGGPPIKKGVVELRVDKVEMGAAVRRTPKNVANPLRAPGAAIEETLMSYIQASMQVDSSIPDLLPGTERVRAPMDISQVGIELTGQSFLPVEAFAIVETPPTNAEYYRTAFKQTVERRNMTVANYHDFDVKEKCRTMGAILCRAVQSFDYIGDSVELTNRRVKTNGPQVRRRMGTEEFSDGWTTLAFDCEDGARAEYTEYRGFTNTQFDPAKDKHLIEMQALARDHYIPFMTLSVVHGQKIGDQEGFGAHMYDIMMPKHQFVEACNRTAAGRQFIQRTPHLWENLRTDLPPMFLEGTGRIDPIGYTDPLFEQRKYVALNLRSVAGMKKEIPHEEHGPSTFYYANYLGVTGKFIQEGDLNVGAFTFGTVNPNYNPQDPGNAHEMFRGCLFTDMLQGNANLAILPHPIIPEETMSVIREAISIRPPPRPLKLDHSKPKSSPAKNADLERLKSTVASFKRSGNRAAGSIDLFAMPHMFDGNTVSQMIGEIARFDRIFAADYAVEDFTNGIHEYRIQLYVK